MSTATTTSASASAPQDSAQELSTRARELTGEVAVAVGRAFSRFTEQRQRARPSLFGLSMSGLGGCRRKAAYQIAETPPSDPDAAVTGENRAANLGTMIHELLLPELAAVLGARAEITVELVVPIDHDHSHGNHDESGAELVVPGRTDLYWPEAKVLLDLKTVGEHKLGHVVGSGPYPEHIVQVAAYALAAERSGHPVDWLGWIYLDRGAGTSYVVVEPFNDELRALVIDRCHELLNYATSPHDAPRDGAGPGERAANLVCNSCPWLRACWGDEARPGQSGVQSSKVEDFGGMQEVLTGYLIARQAESAAKERKEFYRELIIGNTPGVYGNTRWSLSKPSKTVDKNACAKILDASGQSLPMRATEPRLTVAWVAPDQIQGGTS